MKVKNKTALLSVCLLVLSLLSGIGIQAVLYADRLNASRAQAASAAEIFISDAKDRKNTLQDGEEKFQESLETNSDMKAERTEELKKLDLLMLVNPWNKIPEGYTPELAYVDEFAPELSYTNAGEMMDVRCAESLARMMQDCVAAGNIPYICSAYRPHEKQIMLFENKISRVIGEGYSPEEAPEIAAMAVAVPGTSEHELGLSTDIIDADYPYLTSQQEQMPTQIWLMENSWKYGFILRYPNGTSDITGIIYEPWHYRYVGNEFAEEIHNLGITLEEYVAMRRGR